MIATFEFSLRAKKGVLSLLAYQRVLQDPQFVRTFSFSIGMGVLTIIASLILIAPTVYWIRLRLPKLRPVVEFITPMPFVIPAIVLVFGMIRVYSGGLLPLTNTVVGTDVLLVGAYMVLALPYMFRAVDTGLAAIDVRTLTEAAQSLGAGWGTILFRVIFPNLRAALLSGAFITLAMVIGEFTIASFLVGMNAFGPYMSQVGQNKAYESASLAIISFALTWPFMGLIQLVGRGKPGQGQVVGAVRTCQIIHTSRALRSVAAQNHSITTDSCTDAKDGPQPCRFSRSPTSPRPSKTRPRSWISTWTCTRGEFVSFLGPSGCGKTTTLRMIAGFETPTTGTIVINGEDITYRPPNRRNVGMVFQSYALFPNMTVAGNIGFGLKVTKTPAAEIQKTVAEMLDVIHLPELGARYPYQLSGGQQQRVALARALAIHPQVLLLDEPLSALDAKIRVELRSEIRRIQQELGITTVYVTHDQEEALSLSDRIVVMNAGRVEQIGPPFEIYNYPRTTFVASFIGQLNQLPVVVKDASAGAVAFGSQIILTGQRIEAADGTAARLAIRPEEIKLALAGAEATPGNRLSARVDNVMFLGAIVRVRGRGGRPHRGPVAGRGSVQRPPARPAQAGGAGHAGLPAARVLGGGTG